MLKVGGVHAGTCEYTVIRFLSWMSMKDVQKSSKKKRNRRSKYSKKGEVFQAHPL